MIDELIEDFTLMSADGTKVLQKTGTEIGEGLFFAGEDDDVGGRKTVGGAIAGRARSALGGTGAGGEFRYWFTALGCRKSRAPMNGSAESRWLAAELKKIKRERPNLWTNAEVWFRI